MSNKKVNDRTSETRAIQAKAEYDEQRELFSKLGLPVDGYVMQTMKVVKRGKGYALVKREHPVEYVVDNSGTSRSLVTRLSKTTAEKVGGLEVNLKGLGRDTQKSVLENVLCQSVEIGEVDAWN